jgi:hypothetical protein
MPSLLMTVGTVAIPLKHQRWHIPEVAEEVGDKATVASHHKLVRVNKSY